MSEAFLGEVLFCPVLSFPAGLFFYYLSIYLFMSNTGGRVGLGWVGGLVNEFEKYFSMRFWVGWGGVRTEEKTKKRKKKRPA